MSGIYIHIPFCKQACHYCDFHFSTKREKQPEMVRAMARELVLRKGETAGEPIGSIYFGGGTPSLLNKEELLLLISAVYDNYPVSANPEITLEANPDDLSDATLKTMSGLGVNRLSIGVQSFIDRDLKLMNRAHDAREARASLERATGYFENISIDLIYGIPGLQMEEWEANLQQALSYNIPHISSYALTVEPRTALKRFIDKGLVADVDDEAAEGHFLRMMDVLQKEGFVHYEISNFGKPGYFSQNNSAYWQGKPYLGIGPSAHSFDGSSRRWNLRNNPKYLRAIAEGKPAYEEEVLSEQDRYNEYIMTGLRTIWGVSLERVQTEYGLDYYDYLLQQAAGHLRGGLLVLENDTMMVTRRGKFLADGIASDLFRIGRN